LVDTQSVTAVTDFFMTSSEPAGGGVPAHPSVSIPQAEDIIAHLLRHNPTADAAMVRNAYSYSSAAHAGQMRLSGEPYLMHPASVAQTLAEMGFDEHAVAAGLLHDTIEDTSSSLEELDTEFSEQVADIVDGVTKISMMTFDTREEAQAENIRKMILAMSHDIRVPIVKLADRLHNMRTLNFQKPHKRTRIAQETMDIYAPLANRLGLHRIKQELEDLSFRYLKPDVHAHITHWLEENQMEERQLISKVITRIEEIMKHNGISGRVFGRIKQIYSIYKKMQQQGTTLDEMHDIIAFRVIVAELRDCYAVLGLAHALWRPVPGRFKDYISMPKANGYQSLHSTVIGPEGERVEIQIRTEEMDNLAEHGVASHWMYKEHGHAISVQDMPQFQWLRELLDRQRDESDSGEFMQSLRLDLFREEVYVFTPKGEVKQLPEGATPLDFAFLIHSDLGSHCAGAKVNGKLVPLSTPLKSGDMVEVFTDKNRRPSRDWLKVVKTAKARNRIQHYLRTEERAAAIALGKDMLEKEGRRIGLNAGKAAKDGAFGLVRAEFNAGSLDELYASVGYARHTPKTVMNRLLAALHPKAKEAPIAPVPVDAPTRRDEDGIVIQGIEDTLIHFARCCNPVPGDQVVGFISRGRGVIIHTFNCPHVRELEPERLIAVNWNNQETKPFLARMHLLSKNEKGLLAKISSLFAEQDVNIDALQLYSLVDGRSSLNFTVEVRDAVHLYQTIEKLRKLPGIIEVARGSSDEE
jgi:GTP pyrophosphokinase